MQKFVIYYRVSTQQQGDSGLGIDAQKRDVQLFLQTYTKSNFQVLGEFTDIASGSTTSRPEYEVAVSMARHQNATILVAKLDRISRDVETIAGLIKRVDLKVACMPNADKFQLHLYAALAEQERDFISLRTKAALKEAKARGVKLGRPTTNDQLKQIIEASNVRKAHIANSFAEKIRDLVIPMRSAGKSLQEIADAFNRMGMETQRGKSWTPAGVRNILTRLEAISTEV
ncbi:recombinase family protein [Vibrio alfacsensis]|uniref:recombinase family protein n=1 Tax=Vibrio alfacsensis TaxID=1074311 RepID=UPI004069038C